MKFCSKCGVQLADDAKFCAKCGNPVALEEVQPAGNETGNGQQVQENGMSYEKPTQPAGLRLKDFFTSLTTNKNRLIGFIVTCVLAVIVLILVINLASCVFGGGYEAPIKKLCSGMENGDAEEIMEALPFDGVQNALSGLGLSMDTILDSLEDELQGLNIDSVNYKITDKDKIDSDEYRSYISSSFSMFVSSSDIDAMYELEVELTVRTDGNKNTEDVDVAVAKINGDWKIVGGEILDDIM